MNKFIIYLSTMQDKMHICTISAFSSKVSGVIKTY